MKTLLVIAMLCGGAAVHAEESQANLLAQKAEYNHRLTTFAKIAISAHDSYLKMLHTDDPKKRISELTDEIWAYQKQQHSIGDPGGADEEKRVDELMLFVRGGWDLQGLVRWKREAVNSAIHQFMTLGNPKQHPDWILDETKPYIAKIAAIVASPDADPQKPAPMPAAPKLAALITLKSGGIVEAVSV